MVFCPVHQVNTFTMTLNYSLLLLFSFIVDIRFVNPSCAYDVQEINWIHVFVACIQTPHIYNRGIRENRTVGDVASFWSGLKSGVQKKEKKRVIWLPSPHLNPSTSCFTMHFLLPFYKFSSCLISLKKSWGGGGIT